ncbi:MAG: transcription antitermination factor NusB [Clostridia bacterium]|jgi:N utilization substance protein B|nr:transcription antitermination factor NusB [Clostridia bacterium]MCI8944145.1 transcription antitermination factor NusB [Clostridia bacterium]MCI9290185.1 transcription antitermination factor NusB [Clostridia bacterium]MDE6884563.1 transcription antitermination factor NusB [Clostridia bacterium]
MSRRNARLNAYQLIFGYLFSKEIDETALNTMVSADDIQQADEDYIREVVSGVRDNYDDLMSLIADNSKNFKIERIYKPDLAALLLACYEMKYVDDIPLAVSINEVIEIVKVYSTDKSSKFVNGVLKGVYNALKEV